MSTVILSRPVTAVSSKGRRNVENRRRCRCSSRLLLIKCQPVFGPSRAVVTIYYRSTLISAGRGRHRSAMTAAVNVWTTEDTSYCQREQATILNVDQFVLVYFNYFFWLRQDKNCAAISATNSHRNANNFAVCHADARQVERLVLMLSSQCGG